MIIFVQVPKTLYKYSEPSIIRLHLIQTSDNLDRIMKNETFSSHLNKHFNIYMGFRSVGT
jgi:hypothetical protein